MTKTVAITGGIGSGKSTFSIEVRKRGFKLLDSDEQVSLLYKDPNNEFLKFLKKIKLGKAISKNKINKKTISDEIFSNKLLKKELENYIFKIIRKKRENFIKTHKKKREKIIFLDIPLLFENNLSREFDIVISIISSKRERYKRLKVSKKISKALFNKIIKFQTSDIVRKKYSDIVLKNDNTMHKYLKKINKTLDKIVL
tara:strand:- start:144 stop:740 length:597 start_codon:yes stop_codon:yes gene_type:complete